MYNRFALNSFAFSTKSQDRKMNDRNIKDSDNEGPEGATCRSLGKRPKMAAGPILDQRGEMDRLLIVNWDHHDLFRPFRAQETLSCAFTQGVALGLAYLAPSGHVINFFDCERRMPMRVRGKDETRIGRNCFKALRALGVFSTAVKFRHL